MTHTIFHIGGRDFSVPPMNIKTNRIFAGEVLPLARKLNIEMMKPTRPVSDEDVEEGVDYRNDDAFLKMGLDLQMARFAALAERMKVVENADHIRSAEGIEEHMLTIEGAQFEESFRAWGAASGYETVSVGEIKAAAAS